MNSDPIIPIPHEFERAQDPSWLQDSPYGRLVDPEVLYSFAPRRGRGACVPRDLYSYANGGLSSW